MEKLNINQSVGLGGVNASDDVMSLQKALNFIAKRISLAEKLVEDGELGQNPSQSKTVMAIALVQQNLLHYQQPDKLIDVNGKSHQAINQMIVKCAQQDTLNLFLPKITPRQGLSDEDFTQAADLLESEVASIKAVSDVESAGSGYFANQTPCLLFEAHHFSKFTQHQYDESHPNISSAKWNRSLYLGGEKEYTRLQEAMGLDREAALLSASYGRYQIMGFNYKAAGYDNVEWFVRDMFFAEVHHLIAFVHFIKSNSKMQLAIQQKDWPSFARYYNGPQFAQNQYDVKLQNAYEKYA